MESLDNSMEEPPSKRLKVDDSVEGSNSALDSSTTLSTVPSDSTKEAILPPSHSLLGTAPPLQDEGGAIIRLMESDVGISEYIAKNIPKINGIIKQRFTDFLVYEVDQDSNVVHIKSLGMPASLEKKAKGVGEPASEVNVDAPPGEPTVKEEEGVKAEPGTETSLEALDKGPGESSKQASSTEPWPDSFTTRLSPFLSTEKIEEVKKMFLEGPEPPFVSDAGWSGRQAVKATDSGGSGSVDVEENLKMRKENGGKRGGSKRGKDRGGRGGRGGGRSAREDRRKVTSEPIILKETRTSFHQSIRELFNGKLDTETDINESANNGGGSRIVIRWARRGNGGGGGRGGGRTERAPRGTYPPYIHITLQKTNRDTQDALQHLARTLHIQVKDLSTAGTKDKRGVTVQRVSLWRGAKTVEDVWKLANGVPTRQSADDATRVRGERGLRIADLTYRKASLELGMLKGNAFVITLRNVQVDSIETLDQSMNSIKERGFINYYGMQRFGTAAIPTHSIGLALLKSDWHLAVSLILRPRPGEHPDVLAARRAWLDDGDLDRALELLPRRVVAERCILESYKKQRGETRNALGALSTIPRNLRLMYVHAYQSYVWNAIVSERIKNWGAGKPVPGDLVLESGATERVAVGDGMDVEDGEANAKPDADVDEPASGRKGNRKPWQPPRVKTLTEEDIDKYSIFDVVMPLPGNDVAFPGGALGEKYREYLLRDGLDPNDFQRRQKDYTLSGSYRNILHLPRELSWSVLRYTDPDVPLAQSDEDQLLGNEPPAPDPEGRFLALQIRLILGTAAYATMALREVTKTDTSSQFQSSLTQASEDQKFRGADCDDVPKMEVETLKLEA